MNSSSCPCCSLIDYTSCCKPLHDGEKPSSPLALMRSRYSAYAMDLPLYIQKTTHPQSPHFERNFVKWTKDIHEFCKTTRFIRLEILSHRDDWVYFCAHLEQNGQPLKLIEKSHFKEINGHWMYDTALN